MKKKYGIKTLPIDRVLNKEYFMDKSCRKCAPKASLSYSKNYTC